jgi:hypothetical protein
VLRSSANSSISIERVEAEFALGSGDADVLMRYLLSVRGFSGNSL